MGQDDPVMFGPYRVAELLGRGGMGEVHRAHDTEHDRVVALKRLSAVDPGDEAKARFRRESRLAARLAGPHVTTIHDYGEIDGRLYLAMRLVEGTDLRRELADGPLEPARAVRLLTQVSGALDAAHAAGVAHRDVKPSNILLDDADAAVLADFGIARSLAPDATRLTATGGEIGTLDYMAPERLTHAGADHRADVYSLACVLFECLTGRTPFPADDAAGKLAAQLNDPPPAPSLFDWRIPHAMDLVVATGMDKDPARRYPTAGELLAAAATALRQPATTEPATAPELSGDPGQRHIMNAIVAVAGRRPAGDTAADECPYPGLRSFSSADAGRFIGREQAVTDVLVRLSRQSPATGPLLVVGASGTGKSSLLHAGVLPALASADTGRPWPQVATTPGARPVDTLAARLAPLADADPAGLATWLRARPAEFGRLCGQVARRRGRPVLVVDQFEEVFTVGEPDQREAFATLLANAWPALVVLAVRADFLDRCLGLPVLRPALSNPYPLGPLSPAELARVITEPARTAGLRVENGLVDRLITDVGATTGGYDPGALPRLAHALRETWQHRTGGVLTLRGYQDTGGVDRAVARTADNVYNGLSKEDQERLRKALLRMVTVLADGGVARRRANRADIDEDILTSLVAARLVTAEAGGVQLAHDALITAWPRLRDWIDQDRQDLLVRQHLGQAAANWLAGSREPGELYRGARLAAALDWSAGRTDLAPAERDFLRASKKARKRSTRRLRTLVTGLTIFLVAALVAGSVAAVKWGEAARSARAAESQQLAAGSLADAEFDPIGARGNALEAWQRDQTRQARGALLSSATFDYPLIRKTGLNTAHSVAISPDGGMIAAGGTAGRLRVVDSRTGKGLPAKFEGHQSAVEVAFSPDGTMLASMGRGKNDNVRVWELPSGRELTTLPAKGFLAWHPDGTLAALGYPNGLDQPARAVGAWDPHTGVLTAWLTQPYPRGLNPPQDGAFSPSGDRLAVGRTNGVVELWNPATAAPVHTEPAHRDNGTGDDPDRKATPQVVFTGGLLASASAADRAIRLADPVTGAPVGSPIPVEPTFGDLAATADGGHLLAINHDEAGIGRWTVPVGELDATLPGPPESGAADGRLVAVAAAPSGDTVAVKADGRAVLWRRNPFRTFAPIGQPAGVAVSADGGQVAAATDDGDYLWNPTTGALRREAAGSALFAVAYTPDGTRVIGALDGTVVVTPPGGDPRATGIGLTDIGDGGLAAAPDGTRFAVRASGVAADGTSTTILSIVDTKTLATVAAVDVGAGVVSGPVFTPDGASVLATVTTTPAPVRPTETASEVRRWRTDDLTALRSLRVDAPGALLVAPDGRSLLIAKRNQVQVRDLATGEVRREFANLPAAVSTMALSADGRHLAIGMSGDSTIRLYDLPHHVATLTGHEGGTTGLAFSPDGTQLISTGPDTDIVVWPLDPDTAVEKICGDLAAAGDRDRTDLGCAS